MSKRTNSKGQVLCYGCNRPVHIDHFAGMVMTDNGEEIVCDALPCLLAISKLRKDADEPSNDN